MILGVSTGCYHGVGVLTEDALNRIHELGADAVEVYIQGAAEMDPEIVHQVARRVKSTGIRVLSVHPYVFGWENLLFSSYDRQRIWARNHFEEYLAVCSEIGADAYVSHGPPAHHALRADGTLKPVYVDITGELVTRAASVGLRYCLENVSYGLLRTPADVRRHQEAIPDLTYVVDFKSAWKSDYAPAEFLAPTLAESVHHTHVSFRNQGRYGLAAYDVPAALEDPEVCAALAAPVPHVLEIEATDAGQVMTSLTALRVADRAVRAFAEAGVGSSAVVEDLRDEGEQNPKRAMTGNG